MHKIELKKITFESKKIDGILDKIKKPALRASGAVVRKIARDFVKHKNNPNKYSEPGNSPYDHFGLKKSIVFDFLDKNSVVIGPRYIKAGLANVARIHEFGGLRAVKKLDTELIDGVEIGDEAPVTENYLHKKDTVIETGATDRKTGRGIVWIKIRTKAQARCSSHLYKRMVHDSDETETVLYPPRPYMKPALEKSMPSINRIWRNAIH